MSAMTSQIISVSVVWSTVCSGEERNTEENIKLHVTSIFEGNPLVIGGFPSQRVNDAEKKFPFDDIIMLC